MECKFSFRSPPFTNSGTPASQIEMRDSPIDSANSNNAGNLKGNFFRFDPDPKLLDPGSKILSGGNTLMHAQFASGAGDHVTSFQTIEENQKLMQQQFQKMEGFEIQQQEQFRRDLEDQKRILELKQKEYKQAMEHQRNMTQDQILAMQEKQSRILKQQQMQAEAMLKQIQSQMESEMRMKSDMLRNQLSMFSEIQAQNPLQPVDINTVFEQMQKGKTITEIGSGEQDSKVSEDLKQYYEKKCERLVEIHNEEVKELKERNRRILERCNEHKTDYQNDIQTEKDRRISDMSKLREEHCQNIEEIRSEFQKTIEKVILSVQILTACHNQKIWVQRHP